MTYCFGDFVHVVSIEGELILLDEPSDRYLLLSAEDTRALHDAMTGMGNFYGAGKELLGLRILVPSDCPPVWPEDHSGRSGVDNYEWRLRSDFVKEVGPCIIDRIRAMAVLKSVCRRLRRRGLHSALNALRDKKRRCGEGRPDPAHAEALATCLASVASFEAGRVCCLEMSLALTAFCLENGVSAEFVTGVQRYDFLSHAWVESGGAVVADRPDLNTSLYEILRV